MRKDIIEMMLMITEDRKLFYHKDTNSIDHWSFSSNEMKHLSPNHRIPKEDHNNYRLPSYNEIDHKEIMSFYVREFVEDKEMRKCLFNILRRRNYMDDYLDKLKEYDLYEDFIDTCGDVYIQIFMEWAEKYHLTFK